MPIYTYQCTECKHTEDNITSISLRDTPHNCSKCNKNTSIRSELLTAPNISIKGYCYKNCEGHK